MRSALRLVIGNQIGDTPIRNLPLRHSGGSRIFSVPDHSKRRDWLWCRFGLGGGRVFSGAAARENPPATRGLGPGPASRAAGSARPAGMSGSTSCPAGRKRRRGWGSYHPAIRSRFPAGAGNAAATQIELQLLDSRRLADPNIGLSLSYTAPVLNNNPEFDPERLGEGARGLPETRWHVRVHLVRLQHPLCTAVLPWPVRAKPLVMRRGACGGARPRGRPSR